MKGTSLHVSFSPVQLAQFPHPLAKEKLSLDPPTMESIMMRARDLPIAKRDLSQFDRGDMGFIILCGCLVTWMVPGLAFLYSGLARRKSALTLVWAVAAGNGVVIFQWLFWGYSLAFSQGTTNGFIGNLQHIGLRNVLEAASPGSPLLPELLYSFYQMAFACVTAAILMGVVAERGRVLPAMVFIFLWMTIVYCPLAHWVWNPNGWAFKYGVLDFAGGGPVEIGSGVGGLAYSWVLGRRKERELINFRPHNVSLVVLGTFMLWLGWLGFNGGSAFGANTRAVIAIWNTMEAAAFGGLTWCLLDYRIERKFSMVGFCSGTIAGLVAATPSSGFISPWASIPLGIVTGAVCNYATKVKYLVRIDDALDLFAEHAVGGIIGLLWNALFAEAKVIASDGVSTSTGGFFNHNWKQLYIQIAFIVAASAYTFAVTAALAKLINYIPGLHLRGTEEEQAMGMDEVELGEWASDYIEVRRQFNDWVAPESTSVRKGLHAVPEESHNGNGDHVSAGDRHGRTDIGTHEYSGQNGVSHLGESEKP